MGRRARPPGQTEIHTRMPDHLLARLDRQCERRMIHRATIVVRAVEDLVRHLEEQDDLLGPVSPTPVADRLGEDRRLLADRLEGQVYGVRDSYDASAAEREALRRAAAAEAT